MMSSKCNGKKLVIVGGGFVGARLANNLQDLFDVILIDTKQYFQFTPGILRTLIQPDHVHTLKIPHKKYFIHGRFILGNAVQIDDEANQILYRRSGHSDTVTLDYDYLVLCSGSRSKSLFNKALSRSPMITAQDIMHKRGSLQSRGTVSVYALYTIDDCVRAHRYLETAKVIIVVGGGLVGIELLGELLDYYQKLTTKKQSLNIRILLFHSGECLLNQTNVALGKAIFKYYASLKMNHITVEIALNEQVTNISNDRVYTKKNSTGIKADLVFESIGSQPNTEMLAEKHLNEKRYAKCNKDLTLCGVSNSNIFVGGDIVGIAEEKLAQSAEYHAAVIEQNLRLSQNSRSVEKIEKQMTRHSACYKGKDRPIVVSLGKYTGYFSWGNFHFSGFLPAVIKAAIEWKCRFYFRS